MIKIAIVETILNVEQDHPGGMIKVMSSHKTLFLFCESHLLKYITENELNRTDTYGGNTGSGEPWNDLPSIPDIQEPRDYLDENWDVVVKQFWQWKFNIVI